jgi:hypothetical protein
MTMVMKILTTLSMRALLYSEMCTSFVFSCASGVRKYLYFHVLAYLHV